MPLKSKLLIGYSFMCVGYIFMVYIVPNIRLLTTRFIMGERELMSFKLEFYGHMY